MSTRFFKALTRALLLTTLLVTILTACSDDMSDLDAYIADVHARPAEPIPPIPPVKTYTPYVYEGVTGRDPFRASTTEGSDDVAAMSNYDGPKPDADRPREYLERFELDTLAMVGTLSLEDAHWCLIRDPDGVVHRVAVNNYIGRNHGRVVSIRETQLGLSELITDGLGGWLVREASVAIGEG
jgi:type IV pilus assembly protein PilP